MKTPRTEKMCVEQGKAPAYRRYCKRRFWKGNRRAAKLDPQNAPRKVRSFGWP